MSVGVQGPIQALLLEDAGTRLSGFRGLGFRV